MVKKIGREWERKSLNQKFNTKNYLAYKEND